MKLKWKGKCVSFDELPKGDLPLNAVKFKEPTTPVMLNIIASLYTIPILIIVTIIIAIKLGNNKNIGDLFNFWGILVAFLVIFPHELLHAIAFPKGSTVDIWYSPKHLVAFVHSTTPTSKGRFIFISLLPNIVFGFIPFIIWIFIPNSILSLSSFVFSFSLLNLLFGAGDYMNVINAFFQMPRSAVTQLSGFNSYWYIPEQ